VNKRTDAPVFQARARPHRVSRQKKTFCCNPVKAQLVKANETTHTYVAYKNLQVANKVTIKKTGGDLSMNSSQCSQNSLIKAEAWLRRV